MRFYPVNPGEPRLPANWRELIFETVSAGAGTFEIAGAREELSASIVRPANEHRHVACVTGEAADVAGGLEGRNNGANA